MGTEEFDLAIAKVWRPENECDELRKVEVEFDGAGAIEVEWGEMAAVVLSLV